MTEDWNISGSKRNYIDAENIVNADVFVVVITKNWVTDPKTQEELAVAKENNVPVAAIVFDNIDEKPYLQGAKVLLVKHCSSRSPWCIPDFVKELNEKVKTK
jgi:hypothetical protein